jgi:hypothetical protein
MPFDTSNPNRTPILYIEESVKRVGGDDNNDNSNINNKTHSSSKYDTDWRMYIAYRYGKFLFCGTRQPLTISGSKHKKKTSKSREWPVISMSFDYTSDLYSYAVSLMGASKVNITLYVSETTGTALDDLFAHPSHKNFDTLDAERSNRRMELVGYDRLKTSVSYFSSANNSNIVKQMLTNLVCMVHSQIGVGLSFTCSPSAVVSVDAVEAVDAVDAVDAPASQADECEYDYVFSGDPRAYCEP